MNSNMEMKKLKIVLNNFEGWTLTGHTIEKIISHMFPKEEK